MKLAVPLAAAVLVLAGCAGGSDDEPAGGPGEPVSLKDFCASIDQLDEVDTVAQAKKAVGELGTPKEMPADAAAGYAVLRRVVAGVDADTAPEDFGQVLADAMRGSDGQEVQRVQAFAAWVSRSCDLGAPPSP